MNRTHLLYSAKGALLAATLVLMLGAFAFFTLEPTVGRSAVEVFEVTQTVSGAISFMASSSDVIMQGTLDGLTGGTSYGTTTARVRTNNSTGYQMSITFASTAPMIRNGGGGTISTYQYSTGTTNYPSGFNTSVGYSQIGFTANASNTADISTVFEGNGTTLCGSTNGSTFVNNNCWRGASSTNVAASTQLINTAAPTPSSGSTSTVQFRITIPNNPSPVVPDGTYTATATLTATDNP
ncbi:hypothetical protein IPH92_00025 [Candidatus Kaiserbacteria bacterium]|nr:MAG: hypothetical protein IPH92_00025 [Candidatus Kaiserbacteria bacterium]